MIKKELWKREMSNAIEAMIILYKKTDYTNEKIL